MATKRSSARHDRRSRNTPPHASQAPQLRQTASAPYRLKHVEVERALVTGENADLLQRYFGEQNYAELQELARAAASRSLRGGPRVLVLPGIMGSTLGSPRRLFFDDVIWIDPIDIAAGNLMSLALDPGHARYGALGVVLLAYLKLKLRLRNAGYDADFFPYDWRHSLGVGRCLLSGLTPRPIRRETVWREDRRATSARRTTGRSVRRGW